MEDLANWGITLLFMIVCISSLIYALRMMRTNIKKNAQHQERILGMQAETNQLLRELIDAVRQKP